MYILNWVYRAYHESQYYHRPLLYFAALVQTLLYVDFFYYYTIRWVWGCTCIWLVVSSPPCVCLSSDHCIKLTMQEKISCKS